MAESSENKSAQELTGQEEQQKYSHFSAVLVIGQVSWTGRSAGTVERTVLGGSDRQREKDSPS